MKKYDKKAFKLEKFIYSRLPLTARVSEDLRENDKNLVDLFSNDEKRLFDNVVYLPETKEVYCSFYNDRKGEAVLIPVVDLIFEDNEVQRQVKRFMNL